MLKLYFAPRTRAVRIRWLLEELGIPHELERVEFRPQSTPFAQARACRGGHAQPSCRPDPDSDQIGRAVGG